MISLRNYLCSFSILCAAMSHAQVTQTIRGVVIDDESTAPLMGVVVSIPGQPQHLSYTDENGKFRLKNVPVGRLSLTAEIPGYKPITQESLLLNSGKELVVTIKMEEKIQQLQEILIVSESSPVSGVTNNMAIQSVKNVSIKEIKTYPGTFNDVARAAQKLAGVQGNDDSRNDIVVRGNAPWALLYRIEDLDVPNPNHFAQIGSTGGPISLLNINTMSNSDFYNGAFNASFGNVVGAVFDIKQRKGNDSKHEFLGQIGFNGMEIMGEGPLYKKDSSSSRASFLINGRRSFVEVLDKIGLDIGTGGSVPTYQDMTSKFYFPLKHGGYISVFGIGGTSEVDIKQEEESANNFYGDDNEEIATQSDFLLLTTGLKLPIGQGNSYFKTTLGYSLVSQNTLLDTVFQNGSTQRIFSDKSRTDRLSNHSFFKQKFSAKSSVRIGFTTDFLTLKVSQEEPEEANTTLRDGILGVFMFKPYIEHKYKFSQNLISVLGLTSFITNITASQTIEPRFAIRYTIGKNSLSLGYGLHSQIPNYMAYLDRVYDAGGNYTNPNKNLDATKSHHFVLGYERRLTNYLSLKIETYYQYLYDVPISSSSESPYYSIFNLGSDYRAIYDTYTLDNGGKARNYGLDISLDQRLHKGLYYLLSASLYRSLYTHSDGVERSTSFDGRYVINSVVGKEFKLSKKKKEPLLFLDFSSSLTHAGGRRYGTEFKDQQPDYFRIDVQLALRMNLERSTHSWSFNVQNLTDKQNVFTQTIDPQTGQIERSYQTGFFPMLQYTIKF